jgi:hypothetical protein
MKRSPLFVLVVAFLMGCSKQENTTAKKDPAPGSSGNPITAPVDYLGAVAKAGHHSEKVIDTTSINQAIQLFYAQEDRFPKDLNELVAKHYIGGMPPAPSGMGWSYNPQTGELKAVPRPATQ